MEETGRTPGRIAAAAALLLALGGCSQAVSVDTEFPAPVIEALPLKAGLQYDESLTNYRYAEKLPQDGDWSFELGTANRRLFDTLFGSLFRETAPVSTVASARQEVPDLDLIIQPAIEAMEFSLPRQSQTDQYAVWISYNLSIYEPAGELITSWPVKAYGQSDSRTFGAAGSMEQATIKAMRDAAAIIALGFAGQPKVRKALLDNADNANIETEPAD